MIMNPTNGGASAAGDAFLRTSTSKISDSQRLGSQRYKLEVAQIERRGVMLRHAVTSHPVSRLELVGMGAMGGLVGATFGALAHTTNCYSWGAVAAISAIGATTFTLLASTQSKTPLQHAQSKLDQTRKEKECLLKRIADNPDHNYGADEIYTFKRLSERYRESWETFKLLWDVLHTKKYQGDYVEFLNTFSMRIRREFTREESDKIVERIKYCDSLAEAEKVPEFYEVLKRIDIRQPICSDLAQLMFTYSKLILSNSGTDVYRGATAYDAYQALCQEKYEYFKNRLIADERRLLKDIGILRAIAEEERDAALNF